jgi:predicted NAD/FAD-dependent oxidoreductase
MRSLPSHLAKGLNIQRPFLITKLEKKKQKQEEEECAATNTSSSSSSSSSSREQWVLHHEEGQVPQLFDAVVVAVPAEQSIPLLQPLSPALAAPLLNVTSVSCLSVMAAWDQPVDAPFTEWKKRESDEEG